MVKNHSALVEVAKQRRRKKNKFRKRLFGIPLYQDKHPALPVFAPTRLVAEEVTYVLHQPLLYCEVFWEDGEFRIGHEKLGLIAGDRSWEKSVSNFADVFDELYDELNQFLEDSVYLNPLELQAFINGLVKDVQGYPKRQLPTFAPTEIVYKNTTYILHRPPLCRVARVLRGYSIDCRELGINVCARDMNRARAGFAVRFDAEYYYLNGYPDHKLGDILLSSKKAMNGLIKEIHHDTVPKCRHIFLKKRQRRRW
jgi:hypothetical protein